MRAHAPLVSMKFSAQAELPISYFHTVKMSTSNVVGLTCFHGLFILLYFAPVAQLDRASAF